MASIYSVSKNELVEKVLEVGDLLISSREFVEKLTNPITQCTKKLLGLIK